MSRKFRQNIAEKFGKAEKTELDKDLQTQLAMADQTKEQVEALISSIQTALETNGMNKIEKLGQALHTAAAKVGNTSPLGTLLTQASAGERAIGSKQHQLWTQANERIVAALKSFLKEEARTLDQERKKLSDARLEMDAMRNKKRFAKPTDDISRIEAQIEEKTDAFEAQQEILRDLLEKYPRHHEMIRDRIRDLMQIQLHYHQDSVDALESVLRKC